MKCLFLSVSVFVCLTISSAFAFNEKIVGGYEAQVGAYPWMAAIVSANSSNAFYGQFCGATLIRPDWVVTAAHCMAEKSASDIHLVLGRHNLSDTVGERIAAKQIIVHELYDANTQINDIALVQLQKPSKQSPVNVLSLETENLANAGTLATVIGYGVLKEGAWMGPGKLYEVNVPIVSNEDCKAVYGQNDIADSMLCAGYPQGGKDSCQGDSGGPFVVFNSAKIAYLAGIVSWGNGCARPTFYGVYTRVSDFSNWIDDNISHE